MLSDSIITTCPNCKAQFRVTKGQLKIAHGQVRCGNCLHVFSATEHEEKSFHTDDTDGSSEIQNSLTTPTQSAAENKDITKNKKTTAPQKPSISVSLSSEKDLEPLAQTEQTPPTSPLRTLEIKTAAEPTAPIPTLTIEREALVLSSASAKKRKTKNTFWLLTLIAAITGIAIQYFWFNRAELYWHKPYQPFYETLCQHLDCNIPQRFELDKIQNQKLIIQPHKELEGAISINLLLLNSASFEQPYPAIALTFSDLKGKTIAQRVFQPKEYLNFSNNIAPLLPVNQPAQISLELMSPSLRAINYKAELLAPEQ
ncbi:DUF3426 domain-containing protein [Neptuniibacter sp. 2_MG-2023]|uniref:DUF3426 domain-containing protein n=1 Tax=Neptuniibacter sp. 2_MG-2023 TaxID=3062671 RepID=UPI0026E134E5|nr:DUF3426 domain-containing protein [Neptuniibacter sp. 2_MG-2023]MDO6512696.1 DUF3426 domain-containing protein [Neptuniibacter sp. 2_MG-2023]